MKLYLKQWYIHKKYNWGWRELDNYERIFENFEIISEEETDKKRVGYLLTYTEKAIKIVYVNYNNEIRTKYIPISGLVVIDEHASTLAQCLLYRKMNRRDMRKKSELIVREFLKQANRWYSGYLMEKDKYN